MNLSLKGQKYFLFIYIRLIMLVRTIKTNKKFEKSTKRVEYMILIPFEFL